MKKTFAIALHGGAGTRLEEYTQEELAAYHVSMRQIIGEGQSQLAAGATALDAVEHVVRLLEDDPLYNAGRGATYTSDGKHELDAAIMDGSTLRGGAVAGVTTIKNPISLARLVMTETPHVFLMGAGAESLADKLGSHPKLERVPNAYFDTEFAYRKWQETVARERTAAVDPAKKGTVGCVALDCHGNLAAATSTGGIYNKKMGRIGDTPVLGAGTYANNKTCAVSCTGEGELFILNNVGFHVSALMAYQERSLEDATYEVVHNVLPQNTGALIAVDHQGNIALTFNTEGLFCAAADSAGRLQTHIVA